MVPFILLILLSVFAVPLTVVFHIAAATSHWFEKNYNLYFTFIPLEVIIVIGIFLSAINVNNEPNKIWNDTNSKAYIVRKQLEHFINNPQDIEINTNVNSHFSKGDIYIIEKSSQIKHHIFFDNTPSNSWVNWKINENIALQNGYISQREEILYLAESSHVCMVLNSKIIDLLEKVVESNKHTNIHFELFTKEHISTKKLEIVAPKTMTIKGSVENNGKTIYSERL
jgi:hypothetical protein